MWELRYHGANLFKWVLISQIFIKLDNRYSHTVLNKDNYLFRITEANNYYDYAVVER